jgi:hypothetical protein
MVGVQLGPDLKPNLKNIWPCLGPGAQWRSGWRGGAALVAPSLQKRRRRGPIGPRRFRLGPSRLPQTWGIGNALLRNRSQSPEALLPAYAHTIIIIILT